VGIVFLLEVIAELMRSDAPAAGAPPNRAAAPASTPLASNNRRRSVHTVPGDGWSSRMRIVGSFLSSRRRHHRGEDDVVEGVVDERGVEVASPNSAPAGLT